jgi:Arabinogalactan endo-1,4-beta-galactosidase
MKKICSFHLLMLLVLAIFLTGCGGGKNTSAGNIVAGVLPSGFIRGADVSWLSEMESAGYSWYNNSGTKEDLLQILKDHGLNSIRLRVWVNPSGKYATESDMISLAKRASNMGFKIMVDFHYSDTWADPGHQAVPSAWINLSFTGLKTQLYDYTKSVLTALQTAGVTPDWVQIGNETDNGMLWDIAGKASVYPDNFAALINEGYAAVKAVNSSIKVIVHISNGYKSSLYTWMFGTVLKNANYDVIGMSLYPDANNWSAYNSQCLANMNDCASTYGKEIMICEVGMSYTEASACKFFIADLMNKVYSVQGGLGVFYWEPECYNWQGYSKGAFSNSGRPTEALDAFLH